MTLGVERIARLKAALHEANLDALVCALPTNVLLLSGYWPVVGASLAVVARDGRVAVLAPDDERELAERGWAPDVRMFQPGSLTRLTRLVEVVREPLAVLAESMGIAAGRVGYEAGALDEPASYASMAAYGAALLPLLGEALPWATPTPAANTLARLRSTLTGDEIDKVRAACIVARSAFARGAHGLRVGLREPEAAALFQAPLAVEGLARAGVARAGGFVYCMSGPHSALAGAAYARTRSRALDAGDLVLVHCNSFVDGYWTDITRTYCLGAPDTRQREMYEAVLAARAAALDAVRPGTRAADVDAAARAILVERGFGPNFTHATGHGVGFSAINGNALPRLHPASDDQLAAGMVFNVEPAIYVEGYGGVRHCDVVVVTARGAEVLTPFQAGIEYMTIAGSAQFKGR
jgi:Xaa-Pro aminopeptidase